MQVADIAGGEPHVTDLLGLYYMDSLEPGQGVGIERHLQACPECRAEADRTVQTIAALELLPGDERDDLLDNFGALNRKGPPPERFVRFFGDEPEPPPRKPPNGRVIKAIPADPPADGPGDPPPPPAPAAPTNDLPQNTAPPSREALVRPPVHGRFGMRNRRTAALVQAGGLLALVLIVGGLAIGALVRSPGKTSMPTVTAAATAADTATGASVSVFATQRENVVSIRATVNGLKPGAGYRLHAVTSDGQAWPVVNWTSDGRVQDVTGEVRVPLSTVSFFTVSLAGDGPVVSAYLPHSAQPSITPS